MKRIIGLSLISILILFLAGCGITSLEMTTKINPDGSATREMEITTKYKSTIEEYYILPEKDKWEIKEEKKEIKEGAVAKPLYRYQAKGTFSNVNDIPPDYQRKAEFSDKVSRNYIKFKKQNYFFFTLYEYQETFNDIVSAEDFRRGMNELFELGSKAFLDELKRRIGKDYDISKIGETVQKKYRPLFDQAVEAIIKTGWNSSETEQAEDVLDEELDDEAIIKTITTILAEGKSEEEKARLEKEIELALEAGEEKLEEQYSEEDIERKVEETFGVYGVPIFEDYKFKSTVTMPGKIIKTNAKEVVGNTLRWNFEPKDFFIKDYVIYANSRIIHWLNISISALILVLVVGVILFRRRLIQSITKIKKRRE